MGGCRCVFYNCKVNSYKIPGMHFFRFPLKDTKRCDLWIKYSRQYDLYSMPFRRQKNLAICGRHFRDECFMNYKKDRLTARAVPTIHRLSKDKALDYELEINRGVLVTLTESEKPHLISPKDFECPLGFDFDAELSEIVVQYEDEGELAESLTSNSNLEPTNCVQILETIEIPADREGVKRSANCLLTEETTSDEGIEAAKRSRANSHYEDDSSSIADDNAIVLAEATETNSQPTIINHQIMEAEGGLWLQSETFSLQDDAGYQFVEIAEKLQEEITEPGNAPFTQDLSLTHQLEEAYIEADNLRAELNKEMERVETLTSKLTASRMAYTRSEQHVASLKVDIAEIQNANEELKAKSMEVEALQLQIEFEKEERTKLENELSAIKQECNSTKNQMNSLKGLLVKAKSENYSLKKDYENNQILIEKETKLRQEYEQQLQSQQLNHSQIEQQLQQQIVTLEQSLELAREQLTNAKNIISPVETECNRSSCAQKMQVVESQLQKLQEMYDDKVQQYMQQENCYDSLQKSNEKLKADYKMLESNQNQVSTVTTSNSTAPPVVSHQQQQPAAVSAGTGPTKAQLFNGIKRYISSSMCSLLRMEMFGGSEREWKADERQVAVDLLRLGEFVYKFITDEWRFRLPALRDVRDWVNQSAVMDDEEDL